MRAWLRELRKSKGLTLDALATVIGTSKPVVSQWESKTKDPGRDMVFLLADVLGQEVLHRFAEETRCKATTQPGPEAA